MYVTPASYRASDAPLEAEANQAVADEQAQVDERLAVARDSVKILDAVCVQSFPSLKQAIVTLADGTRTGADWGRPAWSASQLIGVTVRLLYDPRQRHLYIDEALP